jgi:ketosteroid isomerase-like protein
MEATQKKIIENYIQAYNSFDVEGMIKDLQQDIVFENISNDQVNLTTKGIVEFKKQAELAKSYFAQREQKITSWKFSGNTVVITIDYKEILAVDTNGKKAGDTLQLKGQSIFEFKDRQLIKIVDKS